MKNQVVLFPIDFSEHAEQALSEFLKMAGTSIKELLLFHVAQRHEKKGLVRQKSPEEQLEELKKKLPGLNKTKLSFEWVHGISQDQIIERAHDIRLDWIVLASKGARGFDQLWGSRSEKIIRETSMPALLIPPGAKLDPLKKITIASDFQTEILSGQLIPMIELIEMTKAHLDLLTINTAHKDLSMQERIHKRHLKNRLRHFTPSFSTHFNKGSVSGGLLDYCRDEEVDMLCMQARSTNGIARLLQDSVSKDLLLKTHLPLVIIK